MYSNNTSHLPAVIYVAESPEQARSYKWQSAAKDLNPNVSVLTEESIRELARGRNHFDLPYDINPGDVLFRHPYNNGYLESSDVQEEYLAATAEGIFLIARCLGATKIIYKKNNTRIFERQLNSKNQVEYKVVKVNADINTTVGENFAHYIQIRREFPSQPFTMKQFEKAKLVAEERGLLMNKDIRSLIDSRDPNLGAPMKKEIISVEITSSLNKTLDIAFSLNVLPAFKLDSKIEKTTKQRIELKIDWEIEF